MTATIQVEKEVEAERAKIASLMRSKWSNRFIWAAIIQGPAATPFMLDLPTYQREM